MSSPERPPKATPILPPMVTPPPPTQPTLIEPTGAYCVPCAACVGLGTEMTSSFLEPPCIQSSVSSAMNTCRHLSASCGHLKRYSLGRSRDTEQNSKAFFPEATILPRLQGRLPSSWSGNHFVWETEAAFLMKERDGVIAKRAQNHFLCWEQPARSLITQWPMLCREQLHSEASPEHAQAHTHAHTGAHTAFTLRWIQASSHPITSYDRH